MPRSSLGAGALDAGWVPVSLLREAHCHSSSFALMRWRAKAGRKTSCSKDNLKRDDDSKKSHPALREDLHAEAAARYCGGACTIGAAAARISARAPVRGG